MSAADRKNQLLDVAGALILEHGLDGLTMEAIAAAAGTSRGLGYAYFENVDDLVLTLYERELEHLVTRVEEAVRNATTFDERVKASMRAYFDIVEERGQLGALLEGSIRSNGSRLAAAAQDRIIGSYLTTLAKHIAGDFKAPRRRMVGYAAVMSSVADMFARMLTNDVIDREEAEEQCVRFILAGFHEILTTR